MIEDEKLGLKIAVNPAEAFWTQLKEKSLKSIDTLNYEIVINQALIELADKKISEANKNGK